MRLEKPKPLCMAYVPLSECSISLKFNFNSVAYIICTMHAPGQRKPCFLPEHKPEQPLLPTHLKSACNVSE